MQNLNENEDENKMKRTPAVVHLLIYTTAGRFGEPTERQELFTSLKKARARASEIASVWISKDGSVTTGSIRSGWLFVERFDVDGEHLEGSSVAISTINDPPVIDILWRYWLERGDNQ
jgi:hypothetical protein